MHTFKHSILFLVLLGVLSLMAPLVAYAIPAATGPPGVGPGTPPGATPPPRQPVPEPASAILIGLGSLGIYGYKKLRDRQNHDTP